MEAINEKRRKRRESHNAVERRRRDHINEKIQELSSLLPLEQCLMRLCQQKGIDEGELGLQMPLGTPIQLPNLNPNNDVNDPSEE